MNIRVLVLRYILLGGLVLGLPANLRAQILGDIEADIPFAFVAEDQAFPAGSYVMRPRGGDDPAIEIRRAGSDEAVVALITRCVGASIPVRTELIFRRYGEREFLAKILVEGNAEKAELERSRAESELRRQGEKAELHSRPARFRKTALDPS